VLDSTKFPLLIVRPYEVAEQVKSEEEAEETPQIAVAEAEIHI
jgi:hypothetical protein